MNSRGPIFIGRDLRTLVPSELERRLRDARVRRKDGSSWSPSANSRGLFFDFSKVEWLELGALAQVVLLIESALRDNLRVTVALPLGRLRQSEKRRLQKFTSKATVENINHRVEMRLRVRSYIEHLRFVEALRADHIKQPVEILANYDSSEMESSEEQAENFGNKINVDKIKNEEWPLNERQYRHIFPLTWFSVDEHEKFHELGWALANVIGAPARGLEIIDANSLANVILYELIENVKDHASVSGWALVAAWARPKKYPARPVNYNLCERPYLEWASQSNSPSVEIVVGDSGVGVKHALRTRFEEASAEGLVIWPDVPGEDRRVLLWSFDRWSTSKDLGKSRGTRGLYRVDRVVRKYQGLITLRSAGSLVGFDHGGSAYDAVIYEPNILSNVPGSLLRVRMPAFREEAISRPALPQKHASLAFMTLDIPMVVPESFSNRHRSRLLSAMRHLPGDRPTCLIVTVKSSSGNPKGVEKIIREAVELRHPAAVVILGLPGGADVIENAVDSINAEYERQSYGYEGKAVNQYEVWDPVLVLSEPNRYYWAGATDEERRVLLALSESRNGVLSAEKIAALVPNQERRQEIRRSFRKDAGLVQLHEDGSIAIAVTSEGIVREVSKLLLQHVEARRAGVLSGGLFRTPTLYLVECWLDVEVILNSIGISPALAGYSLAFLVRNNQSLTLTQNVEIIVDSSVSPERAKLLSSYIGGGEPKFIPVEARAPGLTYVRLASRGANVVIHCDVLLSEESARRCISQVLRDEARPTALTCIFDARESSEPVEIWGIRVPVMSLAKITMLASGDATETAQNINPITRRVEDEERPMASDSYYLSREQLLELAIRANALHFNHLRRASGRHFTFFIDGESLAIEEPVLESFKSEIVKWSREVEMDYGGMALDLWYPMPEARSSEPIEYIATRLYREGDRLLLPPRPISRQAAYGRWIFARGQDYRVRREHVVIIDWGSLTGESVMQLVRLAAEGGAKRVLCLVCLDQLPEDSSSFLQAIASLEVNDRGALTDQITLPGIALYDPGEELSINRREVDVRFRFLAALSLSAYSPYNCPVCIQLARLAEEEYPTALLEAFAARQKERLRPRSAEEIRKGAPIDLDDRVLDSEAIIWMSVFRSKLIRALTSTTLRWEIGQEIYGLHGRICKTGESSREAVWLINFLAVETQWLKQAPFQFKRLRVLLAEMAFELAINSGIPDHDRANSVAILRTASKYIFARRVRLLVRHSIGSERILNQVLYDVFTYSARPYHQTIGVLEPLRSELRAIIDDIETGEISVSGSVAGTLAHLLERVEREFARVEAQNLTPVEAWKKLKRAFGRECTGRHGSVTENMYNVLPGILGYDVDEAIALRERGESAPESFKYVLTWLEGVRENWGPCRRFLDVSVLPFLRPLKGVFQSAEARHFLGEEVCSKLLELAFSRSITSEGEFSRLIDNFAADNLAILSKGKWDVFRNEAEWLWDTIFKAGDFGQSRLIEFLEDCPVKIAEVLNRSYAEALRRFPDIELQKIDGSGPSNDVFVFCTRELLRDTFRQIFDNCDKHRNVPSMVWVNAEIIQKSGRVTIRLSNNNSNHLLRRTPGRGLEKLRKRLESFGGELVATDRTSLPWATYEVQIMLPSWGGE